jgi:hypothetical protein
MSEAKASSNAPPNEKGETEVHSFSSTLDNDDKVLQEMGYKNSFKREFTNLATVSWFIVLIFQS